MTDIARIQESRINEEYILAQYDTATTGERWNEYKKRIETLKTLYRGDWRDAYPSGTGTPGKPLIENVVKNGIHDLAALAAETKPAVVFSQAGDKSEDAEDAELKAKIADTIWEVGNGHRLARRLYMDIAGLGMAVVASAKNDRSDYATFTRLDPERCWPDIRNGTLQDLLYVERVKRREADRMYPGHGFLDSDKIDADCQLVDYYDEDEVVRAIILTDGDRPLKNDPVTIVERWEHRLGVVPVAFVQLDSLDGAVRGMFDQVGDSLLSRNIIVQYIMDYIESMVHAPFRERSVENWQTEPGPKTVYHLDPNEPSSTIERVPPAAPAGAVFGIIDYLEQQASGETIQPPARKGLVTQSIASGTFVDSTQGRLNTVVKELQDLMAELRKQNIYISFEIEKKWLDRKKPLVRAVGKKKTYVPSRDIGDWVYCRVEFGAASGVGRLNADNRIYNALAAGVISHQIARENIDYIEDPTSVQDQIDREVLGEAMKQRFATDPRTPMAALAQVVVAMKEGTSFVDALKEVVPELQKADEMMQQRSVPEGAGGEPTMPPETSPEMQAMALEKGAQPEINLPLPPLQQVITRNLR